MCEYHDPEDWSFDGKYLNKQSGNMEGFTCDTCKEIFSDFNDLKRHIIAHLGVTLQCFEGNETFDLETLSSQHDNLDDKQIITESFTHLGTDYKCLTCNEVFLSQDLLNEHGNNCSLAVENNFHCKREFTNLDQYKKFRKLSKSSPKTCRNCKTKFDDFLIFYKHLSECSKYNSAKKNIRYKCNDCGKKFTKLTKLQIHFLNVHQGVNYECEKCNLKFASQQECDAHKAKECKTKESCCCKTCGKIFSKKDYLKKHEYLHLNILYRCKFCHCAFMKEKSYQKHVEGMNCSKSARKIRLNEFNFKKCRICTTDFEDEEKLIEHFADNHPGENPHQCFCCDLCLPTSKDLQNHIHQHNIQKYTCNLCGKPYTSQEGFRKHRLKHKGAEFKCKFCESEFLNERRFKFHVKTCKKNPESAYHNQENVKSNKKDDKPKQSRQLHWKSNIIMKRLREPDNNSSFNTSTNQSHKEDNLSSFNFFDEPDSGSNDSNVRGWFDDYYKTEEDDVAFGVTKTKSCEPSDVSKGESKEKTRSPFGANLEEAVPSADENDMENMPESSSDQSSNSSRAEDFIEDVELPLNYNFKKCRICLIIFSQEYELLHHFIKVHPDKKAHKCPNCDMDYPLYAQLKEHMKNHGIGMGIFNCDNCSKKFRSEKKMKSHNIRCKGIDAQMALSENRNFKLRVNNEDYCKWCCKKFQTKCGYRRHRQVCKEKRKGNKENKKTEDPSGYDTNPNESVEDDLPPVPEKTSEEEPNEPFTTDVKDVSSRDSILEEKKKDSYAGDPPIDSFPCRLCERKFQYERGIVMHFKADHPGHKPLVCHICNMQLADKLKEHLKTHGIGEEFVCELCGKRFNQKFLSKIHEMWHQGVEFKCNNCKQKFLNKEKMDKHISENRCSNRQSLMRLPCDICGKSYRSKFGLSKHYITHTPKELRPVKNRMNCEFCGKWFETNNGLQRHRRIHTGERPFCCRFCSKAFVQEGNCKSHERIHTGEPRPRKKKNISTEPVTYVADVNSYIFIGLNHNINEQMSLN